MKSRWCCIATFALRCLPGRDTWRGAIMSTSAAARPTSFAAWNRRPDGISPKPTPNRSAAQFADYLVEIVARYPHARTIHLVLDNLNTHRRKSLTERYGEKLGSLLWDRFTVHYTPKHGSWLNQAEIEVSLLSRQCLGRRRIPNIASLGGEVLAWGRRLNRNHTTIEWNFTRKQARRKLHYSITKTRY